MTDTAALAPAAPAAGAAARLEHLPVTVFAIVMGLAGTSLAWQRATRTGHVTPAVGTGLAWLAAGVLAVVASAYLTKVVRHLPAVRAEWRHPVKLAFVPTATISLVILAAAFLDTAPTFSAVLWWVGAPAQLVLTLDVLRTWIGDPRFTLDHVHPAWFIPVVGNLVVPLAGVAHGPRQMSWFFFSVGLVYWLALLPIVLGRLVLGGALPGRLSPTLAVLVAPPALAALAWVRLGGTFGDAPSQILLDVTLFQLLLLATQAPALVRLPFAISGWAYTFPLAAAASAFFGAGAAGLGAGFTWLGATVLAVLSLVVAGLGARTLLAVRRGELCLPDPAPPIPVARTSADGRTDTDLET
ncbi:SLAC1 anion channel family protein [Kineosporia sp. A_224]|uniref:SLAC1 anion channel family protein n=1 Tax=Kineosporia sp. A_224 TaxID=1962180 RepID=UPI000B4B68DF|nr:SLAC1 anion channel family protein [Kineosporia sp. A_224]